MGRYLISGAGVGKWVADRVDGRYWADGSAAIGLEQDGVIIAGVIYENWNGASIVCHMAVDGRLTPEFIGAIFDYAFRVAAVRTVMCPVSSSNEKSIALLRNMGFTVAANIEDAHQDGDLLLFTLKRSACRFLGEKYGKKFARPTAAA